LAEGIKSFEMEIVAHLGTIKPRAIWPRSPVSVRSPRP
jgi:hypothetical protein